MEVRVFRHLKGVCMDKDKENRDVNVYCYFLFIARYGV